MDEIIAQLEYATAKRLTRDYRTVTLGEDDCRKLLDALAKLAALRARMAGAVEVEVSLGHYTIELSWEEQAALLPFDGKRVIVVEAPND